MDTLVQRSSRLNLEVLGGVQVVRIKETASKRRKKVTPVIDLENPTKNVNEATGPIPLEVLHEWATKYGVSPSELSMDSLMQGHDEEQE